MHLHTPLCLLCIGMGCEGVTLNLGWLSPEERFPDHCFSEIVARQRYNGIKNRIQIELDDCCESFKCLREIYRPHILFTRKLEIQPLY
ncbi:hypothetical protein FKM82_015344 [Ascaphus truei]